MGPAFNLADARQATKLLPVRRRLPPVSPYALILALSTYQCTSASGGTRIRDRRAWQGTLQAAEGIHSITDVGEVDPSIGQRV